MANDNQANYARIGLFILAGVVFIAGTLVYLGGFGASKNEFFVETHFTHDVSGLDVGSTVNLRGVRVGTVKRISFVGSEYDVAVPEDGRKIFVLLALDRRLFRLNPAQTPEQTVATLVTKGLHATVAASGITGMSHIELNFPKNQVAGEKISWKPRRTAIPPAPSILQSAADSATQILNQINRMDLLNMWSNAVGTVENANVAIATLNTLLESQGGNITDILGNLREASSSLRDFAQEVKSNPALLLRSSDPDRLPETR